MILFWNVYLCARPVRTCRLKTFVVVDTLFGPDYLHQRWERRKYVIPRCSVSGASVSWHVADAVVALFASSRLSPPMNRHLRFSWPTSRHICLFHAFRLFDASFHLLHLSRIIFACFYSLNSNSNLIVTVHSNTSQTVSTLACCPGYHNVLFVDNSLPPHGQSHSVSLCDFQPKILSISCSCTR